MAKDITRREHGGRVSALWRADTDPPIKQTANVTEQKFGGGSAIVAGTAATTMGAVTQPTQDGMTAGPFPPVHMSAGAGDAVMETIRGFCAQRHDFAIQL